MDILWLHIYNYVYMKQYILWRIRLDLVIMQRRMCYSILCRQLYEWSLMQPLISFHTFIIPAWTAMHAMNVERGEHIT